MTETDKRYMALALKLAEQGAGWTSPNPMVGAVIVKDDQIIGQGYHARCGDLHAERAALKNCTADPAGATLYVTLEPCCHQGRQPPCTEAILKAGIARVVVGSPDPNPLVAGKGNRLLREHGVQVEEHVLQAQCDRLNRAFLKYISTGRPYVVMKYAMTMDGKIAAHTGASQWVTGEEARQHVQTLRHRHRAIMAGVGTVIADDPRLTCRLPGGRDPIRVICDTRLRTPLTAINGWAETLQSGELTDPHDVQKGMDIIVSEAHRLTNMVEELLEFSRIEDGRFTLSVEPLDLKAEVEDAVYTYQKFFRREGIELSYQDCPEEVLPISGDPERLRQVFCNLLDNAAKHGGSGKRIDVSVAQEGAEAVVRIRDYGPGVPEEELPFIKNKFYKGTSKARGSGIGLAVCEEIVTRHEGVLDIGNAQGGGCVVTIRLPIEA